MTARSQSISLALHILTMAVLLILTSGSFIAPPRPTAARTATPLFLAPPPIAIQVSGERSGGSNKSAAPARQGVTPPRSYRTFVPPTTHPDPKLAMTPSIDFDVADIVIASTNYGDPFSKLGIGLYGDKGGHGIGDAPGREGIGDGTKGRPGVSARMSGAMKAAAVIFQVDPEFSEEARKARFQGTVVLMIEIGVDGRAHNPKVVEALGLGLDQKAIEAITQWRFSPAQRGGQPLATTARVEVHFHLM